MVKRAQRSAGNGVLSSYHFKFECGRKLVVALADLRKLQAATLLVASWERFWQKRGFRCANEAPLKAADFSSCLLHTYANVIIGFW